MGSGRSTSVAPGVLGIMAMAFIAVFSCEL
jgi:hypothetical protein